MAGMHAAGLPGSNDGGSWESVLRATGASEDVIEQVRKGVQADVTRARQKDTDAIRELQGQVQGIVQHIQQGGQAQAGGSDTKPAYVRAIEEAGVDPAKLPELHKAFASSGNALMKEARDAIIRELTPFINDTYTQRQESAIASERERMIREYGEENVSKLWPDMEREARNRLKSGHGIRRMEDVLEDLNPSAMRDLVYRSEHKRRIEQAKNTTRGVHEGMATTRRDVAVPTDRQDQAQSHAVKPMPTADDISRIAQEAAAYAGL